jgi:uncharacterized membrane protein
MIATPVEGRPMSAIRRRLDAASFLVMLVTLVLFAVALLTKGLTHDLLLEAGVFLVSAKLVIASHQSRESAATQMKRLDRIETLIKEGLSPRSLTPNIRP